MSHALRTRNWRRRGRRGQVAAVATLLGLLLVVTFIANFLTTVVPNQMQVNDLNHVIQVENEYGRLSALLTSAGAEGSPGMQIVQPLSLGSDGVAPWSAQDGSSVGSGRFGSTASLSFGLLGAMVYSPPLGPPQGGPALPAGCGFTSGAHIGIACTAALTELAYNFSGNSKAFSVTSTLATGLYALNYSTNFSTISIAATLGAKVDLGVYGSNDQVTLSVLGGSSINVTLAGNVDYLNLGGTGTAGVVVSSYGTSDSLYESSAGAGTMRVVSYGNADSITANATAAMAYTAYVTGFNATVPSSQFCPYDNVTKTEVLHGTGATATYAAYFNNTQYTGTLTAAPWTVHDQVVASTPCPFFARQAIPLKSPAVAGTGPVTQLHNTYAPGGEVDFDAGAVVYAQYGAYPVFVDDPGIALTVLGGIGGNVTSAAIWMPFFANVVGSVGGIGTETLDLGLLSTQSYDVNDTASTFAVNPNVPIQITIHTPYAEAWNAFLNVHLAFAGLWSCAPVAVCTGVYSQGGPFGTVSITIPATNLQLLDIGSSIFSLSLS
ncbi:MAG: hypothetical protein L3K02_00725 [Thermoplasmata archaeon]|nr:hypothetical protein [Thermoplasmata archaeon]